MSVSAPFIHRPIATSLLGIAVMLGGVLGYLWLPVSALPQVDFPSIQVTTQLPGASPDTMVALVTAPLERNFGQIPSLATMTSSSSYGISQITLQFDLNRDIDAAAQDVQAAINSAGSTLPRNLPYPPVYSKVNPADAPMVTLAITSNTISVLSLIAVFIPLLFMTGLVGRMFREFALTLTIAVVTSAVVSLTLTPMMCSRLLRQTTHLPSTAGLTQVFHRAVDWSVEGYRRTLEWVLGHEKLTLF